ncbi:Os11g0474522 [Oryza sativa Japonica Group]|uniref:Os11g0474522 protein n=1 Tax=Oryza sativa subsp. japonica TaxID=39947 RepID=A0A0P0Y2G0_ORYSJ|nr:Os11g0474522 [Oryza sativa Japonica Group]
MGRGVGTSPLACGFTRLRPWRDEQGGTSPCHQPLRGPPLLQGPCTTGASDSCQWLEGKKNNMRHDSQREWKDRMGKQSEKKGKKRVLVSDKIGEMA